MTARNETALLWKQKWPVDGLETVAHCPICGSMARVLLHDGLWDKIFFVAPGEWTLWQCSGCRSAYLDPRPDQKTIALAYRHYYTHDDTAAPALSSPRSLIGRARRALGNGYRNARFGTTLRPAIPAGSLIGALVPRLRQPIDFQFRYLPKLASGRPNRVLDIGCGNGAWLSIATTLGWTAMGVEPDRQARDQARARGFDVRESLSNWIDSKNRFDAITLNHVIEHVPDPLATLGQCFALLRPGGRLYIETPNIDALSHNLFGSNWRGLEPPRHLVLFNRLSLAAALRVVGFGRARIHRRPSPLTFLIEQSKRMVDGVDPYAPDMAHPPTLIRWTLRLRSSWATKRVEFLTFTADRPA